MRPDGTRVKNLPPIVAAVPYIMPKRYDAQNSITENIDEEVIKAYIRDKRRSGVRINHMAVIIAAYYKAYQANPKLNWFVVNSHLYERNHFCVSFVILKKRADGSPDETTLKIYLEPSDTIFTIQQKITEAIDANSRTEQKNIIIPRVTVFIHAPTTEISLIAAEERSLYICESGSAKSTYLASPRKNR